VADIGNSVNAAQEARVAQLARLTSRDAVLKAMDEADKLGREAFLRKFQFGKALKYHLYAAGKQYDSKAIVGVAYGFQHPDEGALTSTSFSGGETQAARVLRKLGFIVGPAAVGALPLVLAENEVNASEAFNWNDVTGERYHFPNAYRNLVVPGARFVYYKGARRSDGLRAQPEYFGCGEIGSVYADPETAHLPPAQRQWLAEIADYQPFQRSVPFRDQDSTYLETSTTVVPKNYWGTGVRPVNEDNFARILLLGLGKAVAAQGSPASNQRVSEDPQSSLVAAKDSLLKAITVVMGSAQQAPLSRRPTKRAKEIGDAAERLFFQWLCEAERHDGKREKIRWLASDGEMPGYDIEDARDPARVIGYEVKGTTGPLFGSVELTANELRTARSMGSRYALVFVSRCTSRNPEFQIVWDPAALLESGKWSADPTAYRVSFSRVTGPPVAAA
jgi:hypothetical protein